jgi:hypothetical protein
MATSRIKTSSILQGFPKSRSLLAGNAAYEPGPTAGYVAQGTSNINKFEFPSDTKTVMSVALSGNTQAVGWANGTVAGYFGAEYGTSTGLIDKYTGSTFTKTTISATMGYATEGWGACSNDGTAAYWSGGYDSQIATKYIYKLLYSNDTRSELATLPSIGVYKSGCSNGTTAGYLIRGTDGNATNQGSNQLNKIDFSNDSVSTLSATFTTARYSAGAFANGTTAGYFCGGQTPSNISSIEKLTFSGETMSTLSATLSTARHGASGYSNSGVAGYAAGGNDGSAVAGIDKITYASDTKSTLSASLSAGRNFAGAFAL